MGPPPREPDQHRAQIAALAGRIAAEAGELAESSSGLDHYQLRRLRALQRIAGSIARTAVASEAEPPHGP